MSDDKSKKDYRDDSRIDVNDRNEVDYVTRKHGYTEGNIQVAIHATKSTSRKKIIDWLDRNWKRISGKK